MRRTIGLALLLFLSLAVPAMGAAAHPLETAFLDPAAFGGPEADLAFARASDAGTTVVRLQLIWSVTAPERRPRGFDPTDPADPGYRFAALDEQVRRAVRLGLDPIVYIETAPRWAFVRNHGFLRPSPKAFGDFTLAAARRYGGHFEGLPRVRFWQAWNEPNKLAGPRDEGERARLVPRDGADASPPPSTACVPTTPSSPEGSRRSAQSTVDAPLDFMRRLLCMSKGDTPKPTCKDDDVRSTIWSHHPYTVRRADAHGDCRTTSRSATCRRCRRFSTRRVRAHHVRSHAAVRFWVTEFSWDTSPPDPQGVPLKLHARWVSEALYRMWAAGVSLCVWFRLTTILSASLRTSRGSTSMLRACATSVRSSRSRPSGSLSWRSRRHVGSTSGDGRRAGGRARSSSSSAREARGAASSRRPPTETGSSRPWSWAAGAATSGRASRRRGRRRHSRSR